jgi:hypothetical protein
LQGQQLITGMGSSWEFASSIRARRTPKIPSICVVFN